MGVLQNAKQLSQHWKHQTSECHRHLLLTTIVDIYTNKQGQGQSCFFTGQMLYHQMGCCHHEPFQNRPCVVTSRMGVSTQDV